MWEIWACSAHNLPPHFEPPRLTRFYEVHLPALSPSEGREQDYIRNVIELTKLGLVWAMDPMLTESTHADAHQYPKDAVINRFGDFFIDTSSIAYIFAHAIMHIEANRKHGEEDYIGLFGIGQKSASEYTYQRPGIQHFCMMAVEAGINVVFPSESEIGRTIKYRF